MSADAKITVIVPVYNVEKYLDKCIESIVNQTYKNLEIILVDDGSPDNCPKMCDAWAEKDNRIIVVHKKNGGLSSARNAALEIAQGDYITCVDSDDWIELDMIASMLECAVKNGADIVCSGFYSENINCTCSKQNITEKTYVGQDIVKNLLLDNIRPEACGKLYKASLITQFRFDETIKYAEDLPFNFYLMLKAKKLIITETWFYHYLLNSGNSITSSYITDARANSWKMFNDILAKCKNDENLRNAAIYRFTVYTFGVLSRVMNVKQFKKKYFDEITTAILMHKSEILNNDKIPEKHKKAVSILSVNKNIFSFVYKLRSEIPKTIKFIKFKAAHIVFGFQTFLYTIKANIARLKHKSNFLFFILTPNHQNYGDQAIAISVKKILKGYYIFEINGDLLSRFVEYPTLLKIMLGKNAIAVQGGGFLGTLWFAHGETLLRKVLVLVPNNKIVVFPQSIFYENTEWGKKQLDISKEIYSNCSNLTICARDKISYEQIKEFYPNTAVYLIPDAVLSLNECKSSERQGASILFRDDVEKAISISVQNEVEEFAAKNYSKVNKFDMIADHRFGAEKRDYEVELQLDRFRKSEIVFTDRLHGMIFSAITGTPCIAFPNVSHKVKGVYDWVLKDCPYILFMDSFDKEKAEEFILSVRGKSFEYDNSFVKSYYDELLKIIDGEESIG